MDVWVIVLAHGQDPMEDPSNEGRDAYVQEVVGFFMTEQNARDHARAVWGWDDMVDIIKVTAPAVPCNHHCQKIGNYEPCDCTCFDRDRAQERVRA